MTNKKFPPQSSSENKDSTKPKKKFNNLIDSQSNEMPEYLDRVNPLNQVDTQPTQRISNKPASLEEVLSNKEEGTKPVKASPQPVEEKKSDSYAKIQINEATHHTPIESNLIINKPENSQLEQIKEDSVPQEKKHLEIALPEEPSKIEEDIEDIPAPPPLGEIKFTRPAIDQNGMPLNEKEGTTSQYTNTLSKKKPKNKKSKRSSCLIRSLFILSLGVIITSFAALTFAIFMYYDVAVSLPSVADLRTRTLQFETTRIMDRNGNLLYEINDPTGGSRIYVPISEISPNVIAATIATEDEDFYNNPGFSIRAIVRAFIQNTQSGTIVSGASTITQQLAEHLFLTQEESSSLSYLVKVREALLAQEMTRQYTKDEILEIYLNEIYYGNLAYGIEAAAKTYFGVRAKDLTMAQATFLAGLPQAPSYYDIYSNRDAVLARHQSVVYATRKLSAETNCIKIYESQIPVCVSAEDAVTYSAEIANYEFIPPIHEMLYPHWVNYIRNQLEDVFGSQALYQSGYTVYTTLEPSLQKLAEEAISEQVASLAENNVQSGSLVAIQPSTGEILAMVGSADYYNEDIDGQINMAISPRQPGSTIKPFTYAASFELGYTPATVFWDIQTTFPASEDPYDTSTYTPRNYDYAEHGPITLRTALASSYNIPAVSALKYVGIYDNPSTPRVEGILNYYNRFGISGLNSDHYGYSLALGAAEISLLDMTSAYSVFANYGRYIPPVSITKVTNYAGDVLYEYTPPQGKQVIDPNHAFLISDILSDNAARTPGFGAYSVLNLNFDAAVKTGTTNDLRDNWTIGYTPDLVTGVWIGNPDNTELLNTSGVYGAGPAWANFMTEAINRISGGNPTPFYIPNGIIQEEICAISGTKPSENCPSTRLEYFVSSQPPLSKENDFIQKVVVDTWTGTLASNQCPNNSEIEKVLNIKTPEYKNWISQTTQGKNWAARLGFEGDKLKFIPTESCTTSMPQPIMEFAYPRSGQVIEGKEVRIFVIANATANFGNYEIEWAKGQTTNDGDFNTLYSTSNQSYEPTEVYVWDISSMNTQTVTLRLKLHSNKGTYAETFVTFDINPIRPEPTPLPPTITPTPTYQPTETDDTPALILMTLTPTPAP